MARRRKPESLRYVCVSDLHLGAENSILSALFPGTAKVDPSSIGDPLLRLLECLRVLVNETADGTPPTLILNGDILEFALAHDETAAMVFQTFIAHCFESNPPLFDSTIYYVPGNHDHHLWETARERQYARYVAAAPSEQPLQAPWHASRLFPRDHEELIEAELLTALVHRATSRPVSVRTAYPNLGLEFDNKRVVIHHGHLTESIYLLMSELRSILFPGQVQGLDVWDWEADNYAWIDFFWSALGRSGEAGDDVGMVYAMLQDPTALAALAKNLARYVTGTLHGGEALLRPLAGTAVRAVVRRAAGRERSSPELLSAATRDGLANYLSGPLARQLARERPGDATRPLTFVFGHTHKPFEDTLTLADGVLPVAVVNSGGWVIDTREARPVQGGAVVLVGDAGDVVSIRMYQQTVDGQPVAVSVHPIDKGPFAQRVSACVAGDPEPWSQFAASAASAVAARHLELGRIIERGTAEAQGRS